MVTLLRDLLTWWRSRNLTTVEQMRRLFPAESRMKVRYRQPDDRWRAQ